MVELSPSAPDKAAVPVLCCRRKLEQVLGGSSGSMRPIKLVAFLLLPLLFTISQGIRLEGELSSALRKKLQVGIWFHDLVLRRRRAIQPTGVISPAANVGMNAQISTRREFTEHGGSKSLLPKEEVVGFPASPVASYKPGSSATEPYPTDMDIIDIAGMDGYSPARRKSPIHN
ncbi:hypothetical protein Taro_002314 [Colocasia esculenta]|uniref:Uncharacterized protein n=1 Tax=Colocasia esculenta TaxID=4460 RepID=A0A843TGV7_COLES|nr:hypothetical protein [Colocasia esculenta]